MSKLLKINVRFQGGISGVLRMLWDSDEPPHIADLIFGMDAITVVDSEELTEEEVLELHEEFSRGR